MAAGKMPTTIHPGLLLRATVLGAVLQLVLAGCGHSFPWVALHLMTFGRMMLSASTGYIYGLVSGKGYAPSALGGAVAGGLCALPALAASVLLSDSPAAALAVGTGICLLTGGVGGAFGELGARLRKLGF